MGCWLYDSGASHIMNIKEVLIEQVNVEARASLMDRLEDVEAQLEPVMRKAMKAFDKARTP